MTEPNLPTQDDIFDAGRKSATSELEVIIQHVETMQAGWNRNSPTGGEIWAEYRDILQMLRNARS